MVAVDSPYIRESTLETLILRAAHQRGPGSAMAIHAGGGQSFRFQDTKVRRPYFGGCSSLVSQRAALSVFSGSGPSQSKHWNVRGPLPPGGSARIKLAPQVGQVGLLAWPMEQFCQGTKCPSIRKSN
jgi:hypothetical protein